MPSAPSLTIISKCSVFPDTKSNMEDLKLSVSDLPMLSCHYIQKGGLYTRPNIPFDSFLSHLKHALSQALSHFPPLAGRFITDNNGYIYITCNDAGVDFFHATATHLSVTDILSPLHVPDCVKGFFAFDRTVSYLGHSRPIMALQVTELSDGVFIGVAMNHAVTDGTSFWNFFNTFSQLAKGVKKITKIPDFTRESPLISTAVLKLPPGGPKVTFDENEPLSERIFSFTRDSILRLKAKVNNRKWNDSSDNFNAVELMSKQANDTYFNKVVPILDTWTKPEAEISSFQSLCALLWRAITRARKLNPSKTTTFRMAVNCRPRLTPKMDPLYFGNAIQSIPTYASAGDVMSKELRWCAEQLNKNVVAHDDAMVRKFVKEWEGNPRCFPLGNADGASITMGSSPRFPMYENDFGWGRPLAVRSGKANKFDGKISAFPGREGGGTVDLEVVLSPQTMGGIESDSEFMHFVSCCCQDQQWR